MKIISNRIVFRDKGLWKTRSCFSWSFIFFSAFFLAYCLIYLFLRYYHYDYFFASITPISTLTLILIVFASSLFIALLLYALNYWFNILRLGKNMYNLGFRSVIPQKTKGKPFVLRNLLNQIESSKRIEVFMISGKSFFDDEIENKIFNSLIKKFHRLAPGESIDIYVLKPSSEHLKTRVEHLCYNKKDKEQCLMDYKSWHEKSIKHLEEIFGKNVHEYDAPPIFRIFRFDNVIWVSFYGQGLEGHQTTSLALHLPDTIPTKDSYFNYYYAFSQIIDDMKEEHKS